MPTSLPGIAKQATSQQGYRFRNLYGRLDEAFLQPCWCDIRQDAAAGVEQVSAHADEPHVDEHSHHLVERLQQQRYRATLVSRHDIPTGDGTQRPLGIPAVEDQLLPLAVARRLEALDEPDFRRCSSGYRPQVGALEAVDTLTIKRPCGRDAWVVEADITQFFATIDPDWLVRMLADRMEDGARRRWSRKWLKAGVLDTDGTVLHPVPGSPHGGTGSPILAQVFLHDALDLWCETVVKQHGRGDACLIRDADDFVCAVEDQADAERFYHVLGPRLEQCGLERSGAKTRIIPCRRHRQAGNTSFECLGFECRWGKDRQGREHLQRRTARKKLRASLKRFTAWCQEHRHLRLPVLFQRLNAQLRGYDHDYGVHGNAASLKEFFNQARRRLLTWLNRRSQRHSYTWPGYPAVLERFKAARPRIVGRPQTRPAALSTSADLRKRVFLKSPVREHRTPGSVRGRSGNWPSYRDGPNRPTMLTIPEIFGRAGEVFPPLVNSITVEAVKTPYTFVSLPEFQALPPHRVAQVYWQEMLYRLHWAATSNLLRHQRWFESCRILSVEQPNFLGFCACLRGLAEGAADASHSLGGVPETLATYYNGICAALRGETTSFLVAEALENMLIHFQYVRRLERNERAPQAHRAETAAQYISAIDSAANPVKPLYQELCQMTHPAAQSLYWSTRNVNGKWSATSGNDFESIRDLCKRHLSVIEWIQMQSVNISIFMLQVLNVFPLESLQANVVRAINMSSMPLWRKIQTALQRQGSTRGP